MTENEIQKLIASGNEKAFLLGKALGGICSILQSFEDGCDSYAKQKLKELAEDLMDSVDTLYYKENKLSERCNNEKF